MGRVFTLSRLVLVVQGVKIIPMEDILRTTAVTVVVTHGSDLLSVLVVVGVPANSARERKPVLVAVLVAVVLGRVMSIAPASAV
jgi:hypothetical protein